MRVSSTRGARAHSRHGRSFAPLRMTARVIHYAPTRLRRSPDRLPPRPGPRRRARLRRRGPAARRRRSLRARLAPRRPGRRARPPGLPFGQYTDDTQLARELLLSVREAGGWNPAAFAARIAELFRTGATSAPVQGTRAPRGACWPGPAGRVGHSASLCRQRQRHAGGAAGPSLRRRSGRAPRRGREQSRITHLDPRCAAGRGRRRRRRAAGHGARPARPARSPASSSPVWAEAEDASVARAVAGVRPGSRSRRPRPRPASAPKALDPAHIVSLAGHLGLRDAERRLESLRFPAFAGRLLGHGLHRDRRRRRHRYDGRHGGRARGRPARPRGLAARPAGPAHRSGTTGAHPTLPSSPRDCAPVRALTSSHRSRPRW